MSNPQKYSYELVEDMCSNWWLYGMPQIATPLLYKLQSNQEKLLGKTTHKLRN